MTADAFSENVAECLAAGMNGHIAKPIDMKLVMKEIRRIREAKSMKKISGKWLVCGALALALAAGIAAYFQWGRPQTTTGNENKGTGFKPALDPQTECVNTVAGHYDKF